MRPEIKQTIEELSRLDLSAYPYKDTKRLIGQLGKFGCITVTFHKGKQIMRARPNSNGETFFSKCQLTYKPQQFNKTFQRASTPNKTMFYGCVIPEKLEVGDLNNSRYTVVLEALRWLRDKVSVGFQKITFGKWIVTREINLIAIVQHENFYNKSSYTKELVDAFKSYVKNYPELEEETLFISDYFSDQFAKEDANDDSDYNYLLSACLSEAIVNKGFDGVLYPSVRDGGKGFNVAIKPEIADTCLELVAAGECYIYKNRSKIVVDNYTVVELKENQSNFELLPIDPRYRAGEVECLKEIEITSINDLPKY